MWYDITIRSTKTSKQTSNKRDPLDTCDEEGQWCYSKVLRTRPRLTLSTHSSILRQVVSNTRSRRVVSLISILEQYWMPTSRLRTLVSRAGRLAKGGPGHRRMGDIRLFSCVGELSKCSARTSRPLPGARWPLFIMHDIMVQAVLTQRRRRACPAVGCTTA